jgi:hypothetical protein
MDKTELMMLIVKDIAVAKIRSGGVWDPKTTVREIAEAYRLVTELDSPATTQK